METTIERQDGGGTWRATVTRHPVGWRYQERHDDLVVRDVTFRDWHRVELALRTFEWSLDRDHSTNR